jgi:hypothetical protein
VPEGGRAGLYEVCTDCGPDPQPITRWWADVLGAEARQEEGDWVVTKAVMSRSARVLMEGWVRVPGDSF